MSIESHFVAEESGIIYKENMFYFDGPQGIGLNLSRFRSGVQYCFLEGTGELSFLDLLDFIYKKLMYSVFGKTDSDKLILDPFGSGFQEYLENEIFFEFYMDIENEEDSFAVSLLETILGFQETYKCEKMVRRVVIASGGYNQFDYIEKTKQLDFSKISISEFEKSTFLLAGSSDFNSHVKQELLRTDRSFEPYIFIV